MEMVCASTPAEALAAATAAVDVLQATGMTPADEIT
jgi:hypothetical protein